MASNKQRGGRKKTFTTLEARRKAWDAQDNKDGTKRPGSRKK